MLCSLEEMTSECWMISRGSLAGDDDGGVTETFADVETIITL